jgi:formylglycine-generating enzyme required for sulfatase activity
MVEIPRGWFIMGYDAGELNERPEHEVFLNTFFIDKYEVSAAEFAEFLNEKGNQDDKYFSHDRYSTVIGVKKIDGRPVESKHDPDMYKPREGLERYPANNVSWFGAAAYCTWKGKRLPTEAEWEKAASYDDAKRKPWEERDKQVYPWGNIRPDPTRARYGQQWQKAGFGVMVPVDSLSHGATRLGIYNMSGNVWEWVNDWFRQNYCDFCSPSPDEEVELASRLTAEKRAEDSKDKKKDQRTPPMDNPQGPGVGSFKVLRGGSWYDSHGEWTIRSTYRFWMAPEERYLNTGFRCAK